MVREPIDLHHLGVPRSIATYLLDTPDGPAVVDCGPANAVDTLVEELERRGVPLPDLRHVLLTHIHLDHAGGAGVLVRRNPALTVHVSALGAPHLVDPSRLERSARRIYLDRFDDLWGEIAPVPEENVAVVGDRVAGLDVFPAPGHAVHQVCYLDPDGTVYPGDALGVRIAPGSYIAPYSPPPDIDLAVWHATIDEIVRRAPERLALPHWGVFDDVERHVAELRERLDLWSERVGSGMGVDDFVAAGLAELADAGEQDAPYYGYSDPFVPSFQGLERYWTKRREAARA